MAQSRTPPTPPAVERPAAGAAPTPKAPAVPPPAQAQATNRKKNGRRWASDGGALDSGTYLQGGWVGTIGESRITVKHGCPSAGLPDEVMAKLTASGMVFKTDAKVREEEKDRPRAHA